MKYDPAQYHVLILDTTANKKKSLDTKTYIVRLPLYRLWNVSLFDSASNIEIVAFMNLWRPNNVNGLANFFFLCLCSVSVCERCWETRIRSRDFNCRVQQQVFERLNKVKLAIVNVNNIVFIVKLRHFLMFKLHSIVSYRNVIPGCPNQYPLLPVSTYYWHIYARTMIPDGTKMNILWGTCGMCRKYL